MGSNRFSLMKTIKIVLTKLSSIRFSSKQGYLPW